MQSKVLKRSVIAAAIVAAVSVGGYAIHSGHFIAPAQALAPAADTTAANAAHPD